MDDNEGEDDEGEDDEDEDFDLDEDDFIGEADDGEKAHKNIFKSRDQRVHDR